MARIFDVIEYANEMNDEIVHRFPEQGIGDYRIGSQVIVRESQNAVFFRDGNALDVFKAGRHTIATANIPKIIDFIGKAFQRPHALPCRSLFRFDERICEQEVGHAATDHCPQPGHGIGRGVTARLWHLFLPGKRPAAIRDPDRRHDRHLSQSSEIEERLRTMLLSKLQDVLGETAAKNSVPEMIGLTEEIGAAVRAKAKEEFEAIGLMLKTFYVGNLKPSEKSAQELRDMGMLDMATYTQLQAADAMRDAAQNQSGGAGLTAGIGAGMGIGNLMGQALQGGMQNSSQGGAPGCRRKDARYHDSRRSGAVHESSRR